ncbi:MAG: PEP-CTERM sorting domain-containing protein [Verrucomicrobiaceae bacterium]|nr:MAG: PEP-CTERM sorting domain-containing protein [Verrucomicrobiaceae bacterium]
MPVPRQSTLPAASVIIPSLLLAGILTATADPVAFQGLGFLSEPDAYTRAYGISADGSTVIGGSAIGEYFWSFRWSNGMMTALPKSNASNIAISQGHAVSADGSVIVGMEFDLNTYTTSGYRWSAVDGLQVLPYETGVVNNNVGSADAVSADGSVIAGYGPSAFLWTTADSVTSLPHLTGGENDYSHAHGISADGTVIVGASDSTEGEFAFRWTEVDGTQQLNIPDASWSDAMGISGDASTIVGAFSVGASASETAFAWTALGVVTLSALSIDEGTISRATATSSDGVWAVGESAGRAALWDTRTGSIWDINDIVASQLDFTGWTLETATGISADGKKIVGNGLNPDGTPAGWIIDLNAVPEPSSTGLMAVAMGGLLLRRRRD